MEDKLSNLEQVKRDAERLTLRRIRENAEDAGLPVPPRAAHGDRVLPKAKKGDAKEEQSETQPVEELKEAEAKEAEAPKKGKK
jgi:hypothetical protein